MGSLTLSQPLGITGGEAAPRLLSQHSFIFPSSKARPRGEAGLITHARTTLLLIYTIATRAGRLLPYAALCVYAWLFCHCLAVWTTGDVLVSLTLTLDPLLNMHRFQTRQMSGRPAGHLLACRSGSPQAFCGVVWRGKPGYRRPVACSRHNPPCGMDEQRGRGQQAVREQCYVGTGHAAHCVSLSICVFSVQ